MPIKKEELSIGELFKKVIQSEIAKIHTSIPAEITKINPNNTVDVRPLVKDLDLNKEYKVLPIITNVPVRFVRTTTALISVPIIVGDSGTLLFAERGIKNWQLQGGLQSPEDKRRFNLTDCYFSPDLLINSDGVAFSDDLQIVLKDASVRIKPSGEILLENSNGSVTIKQDGKIELGASAIENAVLGNTLQTLLNVVISVYNGHTHPSNGTPPAQQATPLNGAELSTIVTLE